MKSGPQSNLALVGTRLQFQFAITFLLLFIGVAAAHSADKLKIVADYWPPFTTEQKGQRIAADLVETALSNADIIHETQLLPWNEVLEGLKSGKYDAIVGAWKSTERESYLMFSQPYLENRIKLVGRIDNRIVYKRLDQLAGKKVGLVEGYAYGPEISDSKSIVKVMGATEAGNIKKLIAKKVDFILTDSIVVQAMKEFLPEDVKNELVIYDDAVVIRPLYFALRKNYPNGKAILEKFNKSISGMLADGSYNKILGFSWVKVTNADGVEEYIGSSNVTPGAADPAQQQYGYQVFTDEEPNRKSMAKSKKPKYRVLDQNFDSWRDAANAIEDAHKEGVSPEHDTINKADMNKDLQTGDTFNFLIGEW